MTLPIRTVLATLPSGEYGVDLRDDELAAYLRLHCDRQVDRDREQDHRLRDVLFCDGGVDEMKKRVDKWFDNDTVRMRIKRMIEDSRYSNATKRIVGEMSTVYAEPATRFVGGSAENQKRYEDLVESMQLDEENERINQQFNLHRAIIVTPRVRGSASAPEVVLDVHSAATARAVMHPNDNTLVVGWLTRCEFRTVRGAFTEPAAWLLTTDHERELLDKDFRPIPGTHKEHGLGVNPWIPISTGAKSTPDFWPGEEGADITAGHISGWMVEALMIKETKTATKQPVFSGDATTMARNQALDSGGVIETPEGTSVTTVDIGTDVNTFITSADHSLERVANNHGLSMAGLKHQGVQSAEARELMLAPVRERRKKQVKKFRGYERQLVVVMTLVLAIHAPSLAFQADGWRINFGEPQVLLSKEQRLAIFETERRLGLDNTISFMRREDPDLTEEQAWEQMFGNVDVELKRNEAMRPLQAVSGSMGAATPGTDEQSPRPTKPVMHVIQGGKAKSKPAGKADLSWVAEMVDA